MVAIQGIAVDAIKLYQGNVRDDRPGRVPVQLLQALNVVRALLHRGARA